jgi:hypothetical protein
MTSIEIVKKNIFISREYGPGAYGLDAITVPQTIYRLLQPPPAAGIFQQEQIRLPAQGP